MAQTSVDARLLREAKQTAKSGQEAGYSDEQPVSFRQEKARERKRMKEEEKKAGGGKLSLGIKGRAAGGIKNKILGLIPGYGLYIAFKKALGMGKEKITFFNGIIYVFSNLTPIIYLLIFIASIIPIIIIGGILKSIITSILIAPELQDITF